MKKNHGWNVNMEYLEKLFEDIMEKRAMETSIYRSPKDIIRHNRRAVINAIMGRSNKG